MPCNVGRASEHCSSDQGVHKQSSKYSLKHFCFFFCFLFEFINNFQLVFVVEKYAQLQLLHLRIEKHVFAFAFVFVFVIILFFGLFFFIGYRGRCCCATLRDTPRPCLSCVQQCFLFGQNAFPIQI